MHADRRAHIDSALETAAAPSFESGTHLADRSDPHLRLFGAEEFDHLVAE
jgi:hypothetical protein